MWNLETAFQFYKTACSFLPVHRQRKFSHVLGHASEKSSMTTRPAVERKTGSHRNKSHIFRNERAAVLLSAYWVLPGTLLMPTSKKQRGRCAFTPITLQTQNTHQTVVQKQICVYRHKFNTTNLFHKCNNTLSQTNALHKARALGSFDLVVHYNIDMSMTDYFETSTREHWNLLLLHIDSCCLLWRINEVTDCISQCNHFHYQQNNTHYDCEHVKNITSTWVYNAFYI